MKSELVEIRADFEPDPTSEVVFVVRGARISYDAAKQELAVNDHRAPAPLRGGKQRLIIYCYRTGLEICASDGLTYVPMPYQPAPANLSMSLQAKSGRARFSLLEVHELKSAWIPK